jgi:hypothetical protein
MKYALVLGVLLALVFAPIPASAKGNDLNGFSLGLVLGDPTGLTLRSGLGKRDAIQAHFGFSSYPGSAAAIMVDWTYDVWDLVKSPSRAALMLYMGVGGKGQWFTGRYYAFNNRHDKRYWDDSHFGLGVRGVMGLRLAFLKAPFDLFLEIAPIGIIFVIPDRGAYYDLDAALGFRYRF